MKGIEDVTAPTTAERLTAKEVWDAAVRSHARMTAAAKADAMELALQLEWGNKYYILPIIRADHDRIRELVPENA